MNVAVLLTRGTIIHHTRSLGERKCMPSGNINILENQTQLFSLEQFLM